MKTQEEVKNEVAKAYGYGSFQSALEALYRKEIPSALIYTMTNKFMTLYASQFKPVTVTDVEIVSFMIYEKSYTKDQRDAGLEMAKWMRDKLTKEGKT